MAQSPTRPDNADMDVQRNRLKADLQDLEAVTSVRDELVAKNGVVFTTDGEPINGDLTSDVLRVLADHGAMLPRQQPDDRSTHSALIET